MIIIGGISLLLAAMLTMAFCVEAVSDVAAIRAESSLASVMRAFAAGTLFIVFCFTTATFAVLGFEMIKIGTAR